MTNNDDLLGKADALLSRYRSASLPDFPILTEVVEVPLDRTNHLAAQEEKKNHQAHESPEQLKKELHALEMRLRQNIVTAMEQRITDIIDKRLEMQIKEQGDTALEQISDDIASSIRASTRVLICQAVTEAINAELVLLRSKLNEI